MLSISAAFCGERSHDGVGFLLRASHEVRATSPGFRRQIIYEFRVSRVSLGHEGLRPSEVQIPELAFALAFLNDGLLGLLKALLSLQFTSNPKLLAV